jgi:OOP family OmpA-OmpF porin
MNGFGQCWRSGSWTPDQAAEPCDAVPRAAAPAPAPQPVARSVEPQPAPVVAAPPATRETITLSADVLFDFGSAKLKEPGMRKLDEMAQRVRSAEQITIIGHTDRLGSTQYNQKLSEARAKAVRDYLLPGAAAERMKIVGKGESETVVAGGCKGKAAGRALIECLQADRRVEIELTGPRTLAGEPGLSLQPTSSSSGTSTPASRR